MSSPSAAPCAAVPLSSARAEASRRNGAKSCGPKTPEGKARSAQNALRHGLRAQKYVVLPGESAAAFAELEAALMEELAPEGALQCVLARRVVAAAWRLERAERLEVQLFAENHLTGRSIGLALIRDCNGARSFDTLLRYRSGTLAELWRALRTLKALQAEQAAQAAPRPVPEALVPAPARPADVAAIPAPTPTKQQDEPESPKNPGDSDRARDRAEPGDPSPAHASLPPRPPAMPGGPAPCTRPDEPESRTNPAESAPPAMAGRRPGSSLPPTDPSGAMACRAAPPR